MRMARPLPAAHAPCARRALLASVRRAERHCWRPCATLPSHTSLGELTWPARCSPLAGLSRLSIWGNQLSSLPESLCSACPELVGLQAQENKLTALPAVAWPPKLEAIFIEGNEGLTSLPETLKALPALKRLNLGKLNLDEASTKLAEELKAVVMKQPGGIYWSPAGGREESSA